MLPKLIQSEINKLIIQLWVEVDANDSVAIEKICNELGFHGRSDIVDAYSLIYQTSYSPGGENEPMLELADS